MKIELKPINIVVAILAIAVTVGLLNQYFKEQKTDKILATIEQLQKERAIDSTRTVYVGQQVDSLKARTDRQQIRISELTGTLSKEKRKTNELEKSIDDLLVIISHRPNF